MHTYFCLVCGKLKQGDMQRLERNICEDCEPCDVNEDT